MQLAVVTDIISHFAGLLRIEIDPPRAWERPDGAPRWHLSGTTASNGTHHLLSPDAPTPTPSAPFLITAADSSHDPHLKTWTGNYTRLSHGPMPPLAHVSPLPPLPVCPFGGMSVAGDGGTETATNVKVIWNGPDQAIVDDHQVNMLIGNTAYVDHLAGSLPFASLANVEPLIEEAYAAIPSDVPQLGLSDSQELPLVQSYEEGLATGQSSQAATLHQGTTVDGILTSGDGSPLPATLPTTTLPSAENVAYGQTVVLGHDTAANAAVVVDTSAAPLTTIVQGNAYAIDLIVQSNVVQNEDALATSGAPDLATLVGANSVHNTATFTQLPNVVAGTVTGTLGQAMTVNVVHGNLYDVNAITQQNVLLNNTLYVGTPSVDHYYAVLGGNGQENALTVTHDGPTYDILVVLGNSYQGNVVYQENVLSSNNEVGVAFSPSASAGETLQTGGDTITNQASIATIGAPRWQAESGGLQAFVQDLLKNGDAAKLFPGLPAYGANVQVTIVTGNYYQMNLESQTNVVANSTRTLADLTKGAAAPQQVIAGVDTLSNAATIVAAHALDGQYVNGKAYETAMLVQTNLVDTHASTSAAASPAALVPDLVPFLDPSHAADVGPSAPTTLAAHDAHHAAFA